MKFAIVALLALGCAGMPAPGPCEVKLAELFRECKARIKEECAHHPDGTPVESCPTLKECDARVDAWKVCR